MDFTRNLGPVRINVPDRDVLARNVRRLLARHRGFTIATLNLHHAVNLSLNPSFAQAYAKQSMVVADGRPIVWLSRLSGTSVKLAPGSELILPLCGIARQLNVPVALVGTTHETLLRASARLQAAIPGLRICATIAPAQAFDPDGDEAETIIGELAHRGARLCFLALSTPKQEIFAARAHTLAPRIGFVSTGAGLDFIAGQQRRAPRVVRRLALEWLWRTLENPRRMAPRYARCFLILPRLTLMAIGTRLSIR